MEDARAALVRLSAARGESLAELSRMLRRNAAYLQQFVVRGTPRRLAERDLRLLARHFGVDEAVLGGATDPESRLVPVPFLAVRASAGQGIAADETLIRTEPFAPALLRELGVAPANASLVTAAGDSMAPGIVGGDRLLVDRGDARLGADGVFVFRREDMLSVKRLARVNGDVRVASDNPDYPTVSVPAAELTVIGRVKLLIRRPR